MLGCLCNVLCKMPQGTHENNGCLYPVWHMVIIYNGNRETNEFTWMNELMTLQKNVELLIFYFTHHHSPDYRSL